MLLGAGRGSTGERDTRKGHALNGTKVRVYYNEGSATCEGSVSTGTSGGTRRSPSLGKALRSMNSIRVGSLSHASRKATKRIREDRSRDWRAWRNVPSRASSSRIGTPPSSKRTRPGATLARHLDNSARKKRQIAHLVAQNSNEPFPLPIRVSFPCAHA